MGHILLFDDDTVSLSNLHRQVIHSTATVGQPKTESATEALNALDQLRGTDLIIDGTDNFYSRLLASWAAHELDIPHVWASLLGYDAQLTVFHSGHGPVYEDEFFPFIDTIDLAKQILDRGPYNLPALLDRLGLDNPDAHAAVADATATVNMLHALFGSQRGEIGRKILRQGQVFRATNTWRVSHAAPLLPRNI